MTKTGAHPTARGHLQGVEVGGEEAELHDEQQHAPALWPRGGPVRNERLLGYWLDRPG